MLSKITKKRIMDYITRYANMNGNTPTYREIGAAVGLKSPSSVRRYIEQLKNDGKLTAINETGKKYALPRKTVLDVARDAPQRVRLEVADGGAVLFDCYMEKEGSVSFTGILDASQIKGKVSEVVSCRIDDCG